MVGDLTGLSSELELPGEPFPLGELTGLSNMVGDFTGLSSELELPGEPFPFPVG